MAATSSLYNSSSEILDAGSDDDTSSAHSDGGREFTSSDASSRRPAGRKSKHRTIKRCTVPGCQKGVRSKGLCKAHGGGRRCSYSGCTMSDQGGGYCISHGGGKRCSVDDCKNSAQSKGLCKSHGGGRRCLVPSCTRSSQGGGRCRAHGGGKRCRFPGCDKGEQRGGYCAAHGGGRSRKPIQSFIYTQPEPRMLADGARAHEHQQPILQARLYENQAAWPHGLNFLQTDGLQPYSAQVSSTLPGAMQEPVLGLSTSINVTPPLFLPAPTTFNTGIVEPALAQPSWALGHPLPHHRPALTAHFGPHTIPGHDEVASLPLFGHPLSLSYQNQTHQNPTRSDQLEDGALSYRNLIPGTDRPPDISFHPEDTTGATTFTDQPASYMKFE